MSVEDRTEPDPTKQGESTADDTLFGETRIATGVEIAGKFLLQHKLGQGGMGAVWRSLHETLGIPVAIKFLHPRFAADPQLLRRFGREAKAISVLDHPNVVRVFDFGVHEHVPFLAMEFLAGESLEDWMALHGLPSLDDVLEISLSVLAALDAAHLAGIVHRDLKPDNIFLARGRGGERCVKLVDFGLAHVEDPTDSGPTLTRTDAVAGTATYMSPEQCRSLVVGPSSDLYAFGCVLTKLLQGNPPFDGASPAEVMTRQMFAPPPPLRRPAEAGPISPALERLRLDLLQKAAERRPASAKETAQRLRDALDPESEAVRMATRKSEASLGTREERAAKLGFPVATAVPTTKRDRTRFAHRIRLGQASGVGTDAETALAVQGVHLVDGEPDAVTDSVIVLDAGDQLAEAVEALARLQAAFPLTRVIVCLSDLDNTRMNKLVSAGAADIMGCPVNGGVLARKVDRLFRRRR